MKYKITGML